MKNAIKIMATAVVLTILLVSVIPVSAAKIIRGDCNGDGRVNNKDVIVLFRYLSNSKVKYAAQYDVNMDNRVNNKDVVILFKKISVLDECVVHRWGNWFKIKTDDEGNEGETGTSVRYKRVCSACGESELNKTNSDDICRGEHIWKDAGVIEPTCTETGCRLRICTVCEYLEPYDIIDFLEHNWGEWIVAKEATETENGEKERVCTVCNKVEKAVIDMITKTWDYYVKEGRAEDHSYSWYKLCYDLNLDGFLVSYGICNIKDYRTWGEKPKITRIGEHLGLVRWKNKEGVIIEKQLGLDSPKIIEGLYPATALYLYENGTYLLYGTTGVIEE